VCVSSRLNVLWTRSAVALEYYARSSAGAAARGTSSWPATAARRLLGGISSMFCCSIATSSGLTDRLCLHLIQRIAIRTTESIRITAHNMEIPMISNFPMMNFSLRLQCERRGSSSLTVILYPCLFMSKVYYCCRPILFPNKSLAAWGVLETNCWKRVWRWECVPAKFCSVVIGFLLSISFETRVKVLVHFLLRACPSSLRVNEETRKKTYHKQRSHGRKKRHP